MEKLIDQIDLPGGLRRLDTKALDQVAQELRDELIDCVSTSGGHFASSLGATEISVALHHCFNTPTDRLIWDVGHQAYVHKMLTGRRAGMRRIRQKDGLSGFLKRSESVFDVFDAGHAGTSISAAVGMRIALDRQNDDRFVVSVIGDGSLTCGMAFEALNHAGDMELKRFIIVVNDNEMSISPNVGAISWLFSMAATSQASNRARRYIKDLYQRGYVPKSVFRAMDKAEEATQSFIATPSMLFEAFGFRYIGPVDGHNIAGIVEALEHAKSQDAPVVVHCHTVKGKGYEPAEEDPIKWHGVVPFDRKKGEFGKSGSKGGPSYTEVFGASILEFCRKDPRIIGITAAMAGGTGLDLLQRERPQNFFDVGICEQHAVTFAAGLACEGYRPVCAIYSTFLQRAYDQVLHDVCLQNLPVVFAIDRAGAVGNDGETHQGLFDVAYLRTIPNIVLMSPRDENELRHMLFTALQHNGPVAIRYPRGSGQGVALDEQPLELPIGRAETLRRGRDVLFFCLGPQVHSALLVADRLLRENGISSTVINARFAAPLDTELLKRELPHYECVCTLEDHSLAAGFGSALLELLEEQGIVLQQPLRRFGSGKFFVPHASQAEQHALCGYDPESIYRAVLSRVLGRKLAAVG